VVEDVHAEVALAGGAFDDRAGHTARQNRYAEKGEAATARQALVVAVPAAAGAEELAVTDTGPDRTGAQDACCPASAHDPAVSAVSSLSWEHVAPPVTTPNCLQGAGGTPTGNTAALA
jgi:hypothetical protein